MAGKKSFDETHQQILQGALEVFSAQGYSTATIKDISDRAGCNSVTIFRHFKDKWTLFLQVVERFYPLELDADALDSRLSYVNVHADLSLMADHFFRLLFEHIHILRIFISDGANYEETARRAWYLPEPLMAFAAGYLEAMYPRALSPADAATLAELFVAYIARTCLRSSVHDGNVEADREIARAAGEAMTQSVDMITALLRIHVKKAR